MDIWQIDFLIFKLSIFLKVLTFKFYRINNLPFGRQVLKF